MPSRGPHILQTHDGIQTFGLKIAGAAQISKAANVIPVTEVAIEFDTDAEDWAGKTPIHIAFKAEAGILSLFWGNDGEITEAADTWSDKFPCFDLFDGKTTLRLTAASESDLEYKVYYSRT